MARGRGQQVRSAGDRETSSEVKVCPLCIEPLDFDEQQFYPCPCGYQVCVFCYDKLKLFCNNLCPGCRTEYGSQKDPYDPTVRQTASSPESLPSIPPKNTAQPQPDHFPHQRAPSKGEQAVPGWLPMWGQRTEEQATTSMLASSAADTASAWPSLAASQRQTQVQQPQPSTTQQPAPSHQQQPDSSQDDAASNKAGKHTVVSLPVPLDANQEPSVQADPEGAALLRTVQSAVGNGHLTIEEGTKQLVAFLRQREQSQGKSGSKASKPPPGFAVAANHPSANPAFSEPSGSVASDSASSSHPAQPHADTTHILNTVSSSSVDAAQATARSFQQWAVGMASAQLPSSSSRHIQQAASSSAMPTSSTVFVFPVDMVAASASLWLAPATSGSGQLLSLRLHNHKDPPMLRKRRGPLYARRGLNGAQADQQASSASMASDGKLSLQQSQWLGLSDGLSRSHGPSQPQSRNGYSVGVQNGPGQRELANGLPGNGNANGFSRAA